MSHQFSADSIKNRINEKMKANPELLYHIDNPFLQKYIDIVIESICEELANAPREAINEINDEFRKVARRLR